MKYLSSQNKYGAFYYHDSLLTYIVRGQTVVEIRFDTEPINFSFRADEFLDDIQRKAVKEFVGATEDKLTEAGDIRDLIMAFGSEVEFMITDKVYKMDWEDFYEFAETMTIFTIGKGREELIEETIVREERIEELEDILSELQN